MITIEQLDELEVVLRDYRMLLEFKKPADINLPFVVLPVADPIRVVFDDDVKNQINDKIALVEQNLKAKIAELI